MSSYEQGTKRQAMQKAGSSKMRQSAAEPEAGQRTEDCDYDYHSDSDTDFDVESMETDRQEISRSTTAEEYVTAVKLIRRITLIAERSRSVKPAATLHQILRPLRPLIRGIPRYPQTMFLGPWDITPTVVRSPAGTEVVAAFWNRDLESAIQVQTPREHPAITDVQLDLLVGGVPLPQLANPYFNAWVIQGMLHADKKPPGKPFVLSVFCGDGKPSAQDFLRLICEQVTQLRKTRTVKIGSVLANAEAHSLVKETVSHSSFNGCPKCIMEGTYKRKYKRVSYTNGDTPRVKHSKYQSPRRQYAEFMAGVYNGTHRKAADPDIFPLQPLGIDIIEDVLEGDDRHLLQLDAAKTFFESFTAGAYEVKKMDDKQFRILKFILFRAQFPHERNHGQFKKCIGQWPHWMWNYFLDVAGYVVFGAVLNEEDFKTYCMLHWGVAICKRTRKEKYLKYAELYFKAYVRRFDQRVGWVPYCVHNLLHLVDEVRKKGPLPLNSRKSREIELSSLQHHVDTADGPRAIQQVVRSLTLREQAFPPRPAFTRPIVTNNGRRVILRDDFLLRSETISANDADSWFLASGEQVIKFEQASERGIDCTVIVGRPLKKPATLSFVHPLPVPEGMNAFTSDKEEGKVSLSEERKEYRSSEVVCKLAVVHMKLYTTFMPLVESFANEA